MKLLSPRTGLLVVGAGLLLAGVAVVYLIKNPPLPPGWRIHESEAGKFLVALPPGLDDPGVSDPTYWLGMGVEVILPGKRSVRVRCTELRPSLSKGTPGATLDHLFELMYVRVDGCWELHGITIPDILCRPSEERPIIESYRAVTLRGYPAREVVSRAYGEREKTLIVLIGIRYYVLSAPIMPGVFTEADADLVFRSFRPK